jgi:4-hydroxy-tetrahydrodipicolinate synthase
MPRHPDFAPHDVIRAMLLPFYEDLSVDEPSFGSRQQIIK